MEASKLTSGVKPVIKKFEATNYIENKGNRYVITSGNMFNLEWVVKNTDGVELYKNGQILQKFSSSQTGVEITEHVYDGSSKTIDYRLVAFNDIDIAERSLFAEIIFPLTSLNISEFSIKNYFFKSGSTYTLSNGEPFILQWKVQSAQHVTLLKNGQSYKQFNNGEDSIEMTENVYDGQEKLIEYTLVVTASDQLLQSVEKASVMVIVVFKKHVFTELTVSNYYEKKHDNYIVESGKPFSLNWDIGDAKAAEIKKNGQYFKKVDSSSNSIELTEVVYDGEEKKIQYELFVHSEESGENSGEIINIIVKKSISSTRSFIPLIKQFKANKNVLRNQEDFMLSWEVDHADYVELYVDGNLDTKFTPQITKTFRKADFNGGLKMISYQLIACNQRERVESKPVDLKLKLPFPLGPLAYYIKWTWIPLVALFIFGVIVLGKIFYSVKKPIITEIKPGSFYHSQPITIYGKNFPTGTGALQVIVQNVRAVIQSRSADSLVINCPSNANFSSLKGYVRVGVIINKDTLYAGKAIFSQYFSFSDDNQKIDNPSVPELGDSVATRKMLEALEIEKIKKKKQKDLKRMKKQMEDSLAKASQDSILAVIVNKKTEDDKRSKELEVKRSKWEKVKYDLVVATSTFKTKTFGGVKDVKVKVINNSGYMLENVTVEVSFEKTRKNKIKKNTTLQFTNIAPYSSVIQNSDDGPGNEVIVKVDSIKTKKFD